LSKFVIICQAITNPIIETFYFRNNRQTRKAEFEGIC